MIQATNKGLRTRADLRSRAESGPLTELNGGTGVLRASPADHIRATIRVAGQTPVNTRTSGRSDADQGRARRRRIGRVDRPRVNLRRRRRGR